MAKLWLAQVPEADRLLESDPLALLLGMMLDQQVTFEKAFNGPHVLSQRLGVDRLDATMLATYDPDEFSKIFSTVPAIHRFPGSMAGRAQKLAQLVADKYDGAAERVWTEAKDGSDLIKRLGELPGFGKQKAQIFGALLGKQLGVRPPGWREATGGFGEAGVYRSVADITDEASLVKVREYKKQLKAAAKSAK